MTEITCEEKTHGEGAYGSVKWRNLKKGIHHEGVKRKDHPWPILAYPHGLLYSHLLPRRPLHSHTFVPVDEPSAPRVNRREREVLAPIFPTTIVKRPRIPSELTAALSVAEIDSIGFLPCSRRFLPWSPSHSSFYPLFISRRNLCFIRLYI